MCKDMDESVEELHLLFNWMRSHVVETGIILAVRIQW